MNRRDFLKVAGFGLGALAFKPWDKLWRSDEMLGSSGSFSEIFHTNPSSPDLTHILLDNKTTDAYSTSFKIQPSMDFRATGELDQLVSQKLKDQLNLDALPPDVNIHIDWIGEYAQPIDSPDSSPTSELAKISLTDGTTYIAYSPFVSQLEVRSATDFIPPNLTIDDCEINIHKGGVVTCESYENGIITTDVFHYSNYAFSKVFTEKRYGEPEGIMPGAPLPGEDENLITNPFSLDRKRMIITNSNQVGILTTNIIGNTSLSIFDNCKETPHELPNFLYPPIFSQGKDFAYLAISPVDPAYPASERQMFINHIDAQGNIYGFILPLKYSQLSQYLNAGYQLTMLPPTSDELSIESDVIGIFSILDLEKDEIWLIKFKSLSGRFLIEINQPIIDLLNQSIPEYPAPIIEESIG